VKPPRGDGERKCKHRRMALVQSIDDRLHPLRAALPERVRSYPRPFRRTDGLLHQRANDNAPRMNSFSPSSRAER